MLEELPGLAVQVGAATIKALNEPVKHAKRAIILVFKNESTNSTIQYVNHEIDEGIITETPGLNKLFSLDEDFVVKAQETGNVRPIVKQCHTIDYCEQWNIQGRHGDGSFKLKKLIAIYLRYTKNELAIGAGSTKDEARKNCKTVSLNHRRFVESPGSIGSRAVWEIKEKNKGSPL